MLIAAFGCSHTDKNTFHDNDLPAKSWPEYLDESIKGRVENLGRQGMSNQKIAHNLALYLAKGNRPNVIVVALTEWGRISRVVPHYTRRSDYFFQLGQLAEEPMWKKWDSEFDRIRDQDGHLLPYQEEGVLDMIYMKALASQYDIPIYFLNYYPFGQAADTSLSPAWSMINESDLIIANPYKGGWINHLAWNKFPVIDKWHYGEEAQRYTAERIRAFLNDSERTYVEEQCWYTTYNKTYQMYDYTTGKTPVKSKS